MKKHTFFELKNFLILWSTQSISQLGSSMTAYALTLWLYEKTGSSLSTAALTICFYAPYVLMSIFAGALTDRFDKKKIMLCCDTFAAVCTLTILALFRTGQLAVWHLYLLNAVSGLMNTVQQPASDVAMTMIIPQEHYQRTSGLRSLSRSLISILNPLIATALYSLAGLELVIAIDLGSFAVAFLTLLLFICIPKNEMQQEESILSLAKAGLSFLKQNPMILTLILFMAGVNLVASAFDAILPGYVLPNPKGGSEIRFFRNYPYHLTFAYISFAAKSALLHLPYIVRFTIFNLLFVPSTKPFESSLATEFSTASISFSNPFANRDISFKSEFLYRSINKYNRGILFFSYTSRNSRTQRINSLSLGYFCKIYAL